jgi:hypothetical protein
MKFGLKGKIAAGVLVVGVVSGSSFALANTSAGDQLRAWYDNMFGESVEAIEENTEAYIDDQVPGVIAEYEAAKEEAGVDIDLTRELETGQTMEAIIAAKLGHIGELDAEKEEILAEIGLEYYNVFLDGHFQILDLKQAGLDYATNDLAAFTGDEGEAAVAQMTSDLNAARDEAVEELEEAIQDAQEKLAAEIDNQEEITKRNLRNQVDFEIGDLREEVTVLLEGYVEEQQRIITAAAQDLEDEAIDALDDVVSGINE